MGALMPTSFDLIVEVDSAALRAEFRLLDAAGSQVGYQHVEFRELQPAMVEGLFDLRSFVGRYVAGPGEAGKNAAQLVADIGAFLGREILGLEIYEQLSGGATLCVQLPASAGNDLAAALSRVPWEIARRAWDQQTLAEQNLVIRVVTGQQPRSRGVLEPGKDEPLRVLLVFAEAPGSRPLAARRERRELLELFFKKVFPQRRVEVDVLAHGVTRERLGSQIEERNGYHVVHWSGHGHRNLLELHGEGTEPKYISGGQLVGLFQEAGGFIPRLFFLSACHSGDVLNIKDWVAFQALVEGREPEREQPEAAAAESLGDQLSAQPGYTGTAQALLEAGVPTVIAMRYTVKDEYARDLALKFYDRLLAHKSPKSAAVALGLSRNELRKAGLADPSLAYDACDHVTPVLHGTADPGLTIPPGRSAQLDHREAHPTLRIDELRIEEYPQFVGRTWELAGLGAKWIGDTVEEESSSVALVQGMSGMGKTALAAEAIDLWHRGFDWVFAYQAKPEALRLEEVLRDLHTRLFEQQGVYARHVTQYPAEAIWREADSKEFRGEKRYAALRDNLLRGLRDEAILLVIDNFETNLRPTPSAPASSVAYSCQDPEWDRLLEGVVEGLAGTRSRLLMTCRWPLAALSQGTHLVRLGPLPTGEAALFVRCHPALRELFFTGPTEKALVRRVLTASRGHPLLLDRLGRLAETGAENRALLEEALTSLETRQDFAKLPDLFAARSIGQASEAERAYLHDALESSIDLLLDHAGTEARHLLWILSLANEPVTLELLRPVWLGKTQEQSEQLRQILTEVQLEPLLAYLVALGLVTQEGENKSDPNPTCTCHELVRERITVWMQEHPQERRNRIETAIWIEYGERLVWAYEELSGTDKTTALEVGRCALVYLLRARAFNRLAGFASSLVTSTRNAGLLKSLLPHLEAAASAAPAGRERWSCRTYLADALKGAGRPQASLPLYHEAAQEAKAAGHWRHLGWITGNWAGALREVGDLEESKKKHLESVALKRKAGRPEITALGSELEVYRIDIMQGQAQEVLPELDARLDQIEAWFQRAQAGEIVPEAPDAEILLRVYIVALGIATQAHGALEQWDAAIQRADKMIQVEHAVGATEHEIAMARIGRANAYRCLGRLPDAQRELEEILPVFAEDDYGRAMVLSSLASIFDGKGDLSHAIEVDRRALAIRNQLPNPADRAQSHEKLAICLERSGQTTLAAEGQYHRLASLTYKLVAGLGQDLKTSLHIYSVRFHRANQEGTTVVVPRLEELLARPDFEPLRRWLEAGTTNYSELQKSIDQFLDSARTAALQTESRPNEP